jgi:hypothetical protein
MGMKYKFDDVGCWIHLAEEWDKCSNLLYLKPTHALLSNTLSHPHFKTLKLLKNVL